MKITLPRKLGPQCPHCGSKHTGLIRDSHSKKNKRKRHLVPHLQWHLRPRG